MSDYDKEIEEAAVKYTGDQLDNDKSISANNSAFLLSFKIEHAFKAGANYQKEKDGERIKRYEKYLSCKYSHDFQYLQGSAFFCNKCGYSRGELSLNALKEASADKSAPNSEG